MAELSEAPAGTANLTSPKFLQALLERHGLRPNHALGQNFLIDRFTLDSIVDAAELGPSDHVLEVGPGLGSLTEQLMARAGHVTACEKDAGLYRILKERWGDAPNLTLVHGDALALDHAALAEAGVRKLVSNLPYSVGTRVVVDAATQPEPPVTMVMLVQREVAERFAARPATSDMGPVSVWLQQRYSVEIVRHVKPTCFWPKPEVTSSVVRLRRHADLPLTDAERAALMEITRIAFLHRRKQMASLFRAAPAPWTMSPDRVRALLADCGADPQARAEALSVPQWCKIASAVAAGQA